MRDRPGKHRDGNEGQVWAVVAFAIGWLLFTALCFSGCGQMKGKSVVGPQGDVGAQGSPGANGSNGLNGAAGPTGAAGQDAHLSPIQLCPGAPSYPSAFIEVAFCIEGKLYGVYSANGGFMTYLPPGAYSSNGIGSACNFTVLPDCVIQ